LGSDFPLGKGSPQDGLRHVKYEDSNFIRRISCLFGNEGGLLYDVSYVKCDISSLILGCSFHEIAFLISKGWFYLPDVIFPVMCGLWLARQAKNYKPTNTVVVLF